MFTISLCMIVKNENKVLSRVLECAKQFADEIVIVDTGSTDNTKEIAKTYTEKVFDFIWVDDFSKARNYAFSKATCDYQMWLDADDYLSQESIKQIIELKKSSTDVDVYMFKYAVGQQTNGTFSVNYYRERLLRRECGFSWEGFVHEAISPCGRIEYKDIVIEHRKEEAGDPKRNLKLYRKALKRGITFNAREMYYYSRELFYNGYFKKAIKDFKRYLKTENTYMPDNYGARLMLCDCYMKIGRPTYAKLTLFDCLDSHTPTAEVCCKLAEIYQQTKELKKAIFWYKTALNCEKQNFGFVMQGYQDIVPCLELTKLFYEIEDYNQSKQFHLLSKQIQPKHPSVIFNEKFFES